jgi:hypothetical protein
VSVDHPEWQGLIDPDETILWQGAPDHAFHWKTDQPKGILMGLVFMGFSIFWMSGVFLAGGYFWMFGLILFATGAFNAFGIHFYDTWQRRKTFYTLTSKRAFIATRGLRGKSLNSYLINASNRIKFEQGVKSSIFFAQETKNTGNGFKTVDVGFRYLDDAQTVMTHMRQIQQEAQT